MERGGRGGKWKGRVVTPIRLKSDISKTTGDAI